MWSIRTWCSKESSRRSTRRRPYLKKWVKRRLWCQSGSVRLQVRSTKNRKGLTSSWKGVRGTRASSKSLDRGWEVNVPLTIRSQDQSLTRCWRSWRNYRPKVQLSDSPSKQMLWRPKQNISSRRLVYCCWNLEKRLSRKLEGHRTRIQILPRIHRPNYVRNHWNKGWRSMQPQIFQGLAKN